MVEVAAVPPTQQSRPARVSDAHARQCRGRTIDALLAHGISAPERLLFMAEADLYSCPLGQGVTSAP
jgi:hypothetical protein